MLRTLQQLLEGSKGGGWYDALKEEFDKPYWEELSAFLEDERKNAGEGRKVLPVEEREALAALLLCPLKNVKVVILGQDPYHGPSQANGLAFSTNEGVPIPPSLRNIFKELQNDLAAEGNVAFDQPSDGMLNGWAKEGVLLLNTCLTVR